MILTAVMAHQRKLIRQAVAAMLVAANTAAGSRVTTTRVEPHKRTQLPAISVYTLSEDTDLKLSANSAPVEYTRNLKLEITAWVAHSDTYPVDDAMDDLAEQIEAVMGGDIYLNNTAADSIISATEFQIVEDDGSSDPLIGIMTLTFDVTYRTSPVDPRSVNLSDFTTVGTELRIPAATADNEMQDQFTVET